MRVLICGSREWARVGPICAVLNGLQSLYSPELTIIEGCCPTGADNVACLWRPDLDHEHYPAEWDKYGKAAGPIRNQQMLDVGRPDVVYAFKDNFDWTLSKGGTEDMVKRARGAGIPTYVMQGKW